jgi:hypothetical protein
MATARQNFAKQSQGVVSSHEVAANCAARQNTYIFVTTALGIWDEPGALISMASAWTPFLSSESSAFITARC